MNTPTSRFHKPWLLIAAGTIVVIILILIVGKVSADNAGKHYQQSLASWQKSGKVALLAAVPTSNNPDAYPGTIDEQQQLDKQKAACDGYQKVVSALQSSANLPPQLNGNPFGGLSSQYKQAHDRNTKVQATAGSYIHQATNDYQMMLTQCKWSYGAGNYGFSDYVKDRDANTALLLPDGATSNGDTCHISGGCLPNDAAKLKEYVKTYRAAYIDYDVRDANRYDTKQACTGTLTAAWCPLGKDTIQQYAAAAEPWLQAIDSSSSSVAGTPDGDKIEAQHQILLQKQQTINHALTVAAQKAFPNVTVTDDANGSDDIARQLAAQLLDKLQTKAAALQNTQF